MVSQLRELTENAEIWMQLQSEAHVDRLRLTEKLLQNMTALCYRYCRAPGAALADLAFTVCICVCVCVCV